jgi:hypothetical protein
MDPSEGGLSKELRDEIGSPRRRVLAAVVNVVDDLLTKGDQISLPWKLEYMHVLGRLLDAAQAAGRLVILTSDHGHVLEQVAARDWIEHLLASPVYQRQASLAGRTALSADLLRSILSALQDRGDTKCSILPGSRRACAKERGKMRLQSFRRPSGRAVAHVAHPILGRCCSPEADGVPANPKN